MLTVTADELWRGVLAETSPRNKKGRGKRGKRRLRNDLNRGQRIGEGLASYVLFPSCVEIAAHISPFLSFVNDELGTNQTVQNWSIIKISCL